MQGGAARIAEPSKKDSPAHNVTPTPAPIAAAAMSDGEILAHARKLAELLGQGNGREVRKHFTDSLRDSGSLTVWPGRVRRMGTLREDQ